MPTLNERLAALAFINRLAKKKRDEERNDGMSWDEAAEELDDIIIEARRLLNSPDYIYPIVFCKQCNKNLKKCKC